MKNFKPLQRHPSLVPFSKDHHFGLLLTWKIKQGLDNAVLPVRISNYVLYFFEQDLQTHFLDEERHIFSLLPKEDALRLQAEEEHKSIRKLICEIESDKTNISLLQRFADELKNHIRFEERSLFNHVQSYIVKNKLTIDFEDDIKGRTEMDLAWHDAFWETNRKQEIS